MKERLFAAILVGVGLLVHAVVGVETYLDEIGIALWQVL